MTVCVYGLVAEGRQNTLRCVFERQHPFPPACCVISHPPAQKYPLFALVSCCVRFLGGRVAPQPQRRISSRFGRFCGGLSGRRKKQDKGLAAAPLAAPNGGRERQCGNRKYAERCGEYGKAKSFTVASWLDIWMEHYAKIKLISRQNGRVEEVPLKTKNAYRTFPLSAPVGVSVWVRKGK